MPEKLLDLGKTVGTATATHSLTLYRASSGALVFGAGTVQWSWGLDGTHDGPQTTPDLAMQQATVNLFADMNIQPSTLAAGLALAAPSTDVVAPTSTITSFTNGATFQAGVPVTIGGTATDAGGVVAAVEVSTDGGATWHRAVGRSSWTYSWTPATTGPVVVQTRAVDDSANVQTPSGGLNATVQLVPTSTTGLVASYGFNEGSGVSVADSSRTDNVGTISGATWVTGGMFGGALSFNGANSFVTIPDSASLHLTNGMTIEAWIKPATEEGFTTVVLKESSNDLNYGLYGSDGTGNPPSAYVNPSTSSTKGARGVSALALNTWSHLAATYDGSSLNLYVNGVLVGSQNVPGVLETSTGALRIGGNSIWGEYFNGLIDELRIYNRALNAGEIQYDMSAGVSVAMTILEVVAPTGSVATPSSGSNVSGLVTVSANAADNVAVAGVRFLLDGQQLGTEDITAPYSISWDSTKVTNGSHVLSAVVRDTVGNTTTTAGVTVQVNNPADATAPAVTTVTSQTGNYLAGTTILSAFASDNIGVVGVQYILNGVNLGVEDTTAPFQMAWNTTTVADGSYNLVAVVRDAAGNTTTSAAVSVTVDNTQPTVTAKSPIAGASGVSPASNVSVTFSESIQPGLMSLALTDANGNAVSAGLQYDDATRTAMLNPHQDLALGATYTATLASARDLAGNVLAAPVTWSFTTDTVVTNASFWDNSVAPSTASANDTSAVEVGLKFKSDVDGYVTGLRFYKGTANTGTHVGHLWSANGTLLATATFSDETVTGWQQVSFGVPVAITANTVYVASYFAPAGGYAVNSAYFATAGIDSGPLHALSNGASGGNGVFKYAVAGGFPTSSSNSSNYWVDVVFSNNTADTTAPTVTARTPLAGATGVPTNNSMTATFSESVQSATISFVLRDAGGNAVSATVDYNDTTQTATLTPSAALASLAGYTATLSGTKDVAGNTMTSVSWTFTTGGVDTTAPTVLGHSPVSNATEVSPSSSITVTFSESVQFPTVSFVVTDAQNNIVTGALDYDDTTRTASLSAAGGDDGPGTAPFLAPSSSYTVTMSGAKDLAGNTMSPVSWSFSTAASLVGVSVWNNTTVPAVSSASDTSPVELGVKFRTDVSGYVTGIRFFKGGANTGTHVGHLWTNTGTLLAAATFTSESATGWQQVSFGTPVAISANTTYVVSYYAPSGGYAVNGAYFATSGANNGPLHMLANGVDGGNGLYRYGSGGGFPSLTFNSSNYWVDVVFSNNIADGTAPTVTAQTPSPAATNVSTGTTVTATFSESVRANTISMALTDANGTAVVAAVSYNDATHTVVLTPTVVLAQSAAYTVTLSGAEDLADNDMAATSWSFTTSGAQTNSSIWGLSTVPDVTSSSDHNAVELGVKFRADRNGYIMGLRFYKGTTNTGTHLGHLWTSTGTLLATATFTNETGTGWQQVSFSSPVAITANTTYVASYYAPSGGYAYSHGYFAGSTFTNGPLSALSTAEGNGNGLYRYVVGGGFPSTSFNSTNYWVDVVFNDSVSDSTAPTVTAKTPTAGQSGVNLTTTVNVTFSEPVQAGTISLVLKDAAGNTVNGSLVYDQVTQVATFTPSASLTSAAVYTVTLSGTKDMVGNTMASTSWSFTTKGVVTQTTTSDFASGTFNGTVATNAGGGALQLEGSFLDEFSGTQLNAATWGTSNWSSSGANTVAGGVLSVKGTQVLSAQTYTGKTVEGSVKFAATAYQHFGFATGLDNASTNYWAIFSTSNTSNTLFARVDKKGVTQDVNLGALPTGFHAYRVESTATGFSFYVDGTLKTTIALAFPTGTGLRIAMSAFNTSTSLQADSVQIAGYASTGTYTSAALDAGQAVNWQNVNWQANTPTGTSVQVKIRVSNDGINWSDWVIMDNGSAANLTGRYIQYTVTLTTTDATKTPEFYGISFDFLVI